MKTRKILSVMVVSAALVLCTPERAEAGSRTVSIIGGVGGGIVVVGGAFIIWGMAAFSKNENSPGEDEPGHAVYFDPQEGPGEPEDVPVQNAPALHLPLLTLRF
jgi:hypothetical protein